MSPTFEPIGSDRFLKKLATVLFCDFDAAFDYDPTFTIVDTDASYEVCYSFGFLALKVRPVLPSPLLTVEVLRFSWNVGVGVYCPRESFAGEERLAKTLPAIPEKPVDIVSGPCLVDVD